LKTNLFGFYQHLKLIRYLPAASVTTKLIAKFASAGGKFKSPASAVIFQQLQTNHQLKMQA
jgi:hypothetical protein